MGLGLLGGGGGVRGVNPKHSTMNPKPLVNFRAYALGRGGTGVGV